MERAVRCFVRRYNGNVRLVVQKTFSVPVPERDHQRLVTSNCVLFLKAA